MPPRKLPLRGNALVLLAALLYVAWLGVRWLPLPPSSEEIPLYASRVWDMQNEIARSGHIAWWSSAFMLGSSNALPYASFPLVPWFFLARVFGLLLPGKFIALASIGASGVTMYYCARRFVPSELGATFAGIVYMLHPHFLSADIHSEHISVSLFAALLPLGWLMLARVADEGRFVDVFACALAFTLLQWTQSKLMAVHLPFFGAYVVWSVSRSPGRRRAKIRTMAVLGGLTALLAAFIVVPSLREVRLMKLFEGDPFDGWQQMYSTGSLLSLVHRDTGDGSYLGIVLFAVVAVTALWPVRKRAAPSFFWLCVAFVVAGVALGHGPKAVGPALVTAIFGTEERYWTAATYWSWGCAILLAIGAVGAFVMRARITSLGGRIGIILALLGFWFVPWFRVLEVIPLYGQVRAPESFAEEPAILFAALIAGFFVADVLEPLLASKHARAPACAVLALVGLLVADVWPFQQWAVQSDLSASSVEGFASVFARLGDEAKQEGGRVSTSTSKALFLMGPSWGGPPLANEAHLRYMGPRWSGMLQSVAYSAPPLNRNFLELVGVHWLVVDKNVGWTDGQVAAYRGTYPVEIENDDLVVFHVTTARPYVSGYEHTALALGDPPHLPNLALMLSGEGYLLVDAPVDRLEDVSPSDLASFAALYVPSTWMVPPLADLASRVHMVEEQRPPPLPPPTPATDALGDVTLSRPSAERIEARFTAARPCTAVIQESYYPFWGATLDGSPAAVERVAYGLMGVPVPAGQHQLVLEYHPPALYLLSTLVSAGALVAAAVMAWRELRLRRT